MNKRTKSNSIRIIGGRWRGRRLPVLDSKGLRPTIDRVRETVFNWLMNDLSGSVCLDAFAGSGALGFECLSRGAHFVQFIESKREVVSILHENAETLQLDNTEANIKLMSAIDYLNQSATKRFDLVFLDPPFSSDLLPQLLCSLLENKWLAQGALIYIEQSVSTPEFAVPPSLELYREGRAGQSRYRLYSS